MTADESEALVADDDPRSPLLADAGELADDVAHLVSNAISGDQAAWSEIVDRFGARVWAICRAHRLSQADAADVFQQTWLRVLEHLDSLRDPARLGAWIGTTCRHEALAAIRRAKRSQPVGDPDLLDRAAGPAGDPEAPIVIADRNAELWKAFGRLSLRCQEVLRVLVVDVLEGRPSYELAAAALGIPIGSLGPTRGRCLAQLRGFLTEGIADANGAS
jgi:RNA polymerase sigma factor (sigma-70 family)